MAFKISNHGIPMCVVLCRVAWQVLLIEDNGDGMDRATTERAMTLGHEQVQRCQSETHRGTFVTLVHIQDPSSTMKPYYARPHCMCVPG